MHSLTSLFFLENGRLASLFMPGKDIMHSLCGKDRHRLGHPSFHYSTTHSTHSHVSGCNSRVRVQVWTLLQVKVKVDQAVLSTGILAR